VRGKDAMMDERDWLAERFAEHRSHVRAVAYRMLASESEADDAERGGRFVVTGS
jgi:DNA-directed RNA polymerase specialized sigma24 family protein